MSHHKRPALKHYLWQSVGIFIFMAIVIFILDRVSAQSFLWAVAITSIASSACIVFTRPHAIAAEPRRMIGSYILSIIIGFIFLHIGIELTPLCGSQLAIEFVGAGSVAVFVFLISLLGFQHPPAAGVVFGFSIEPWNKYAVIVIITSIIVLIFLHKLSRTWMKDLYESTDSR